MSSDVSTDLVHDHTESATCAALAIRAEGGCSLCSSKALATVRMIIRYAWHTSLHKCESLTGWNTDTDSTCKCSLNQDWCLSRRSSEAGNLPVI